MSTLKSRPGSHGLQILEICPGVLVIRTNDRVLEGFRFGAPPFPVRESLPPNSAVIVLSLRHI